MNKVLFEALQNAKSHPNLQTATTKEETKDGEITLLDCLEEFKKSELLDE